MKKLLVVALSVVMVMAFAAFANAATETFTGNVNAELDLMGNANYLANGYGDVWAEIDYAKDFTEGWTGGLKFRIIPGKTSTQVVGVVDPVTGLPVDANLDGINDTVTITYQGADAVKFEGNGYITYTADMYDVTMQTGGDFGSGDALNDGYKTVGAPNVLVNVKPMEGFTGTLFVGEALKEFELGVKAVYSVDPLTVGFGYMSTTGALAADVTDDGNSMNIWASYKIGDSLTVGLENATRTGNANANLGTAMMVKAGYTADALSANLKYYSKDDAFAMKTDKAAEEAYLPDRFWDATTGEGTLIIVDASYKLSDTVTAGAEVDMTTATGINGTDFDGNAVNDASMGYKVYVTNEIVPGLKLEAAYQAFIDAKAYVKLSATL